MRTALPLIRDFDADLAVTETFDAAMDVLLAYAAKLSFEAATYIFASQPTALDGSIRLPLVLRMKPKATQYNRIYARYKYYQHDPIYRAAMRTTLPICWSFKNKNLIDGLETHPSAELADMKKRLLQFGYYHGISVPLHLPNRKLASIGMISRCSSERFARTTRSCSDIVMVLAHHFHERVSRMLPNESIKDSRERLSPREIECLYWAAQGMTTHRIADHLGIADVTVRFHLKNAAAKLSAVNRAQTVAKATYHGLINPAAPLSSNLHLT